MFETQLSKTRVLVVISFIILALFCLFLRLGFLQIFRSSQFQSLAQRQSRATVEMPPVRGKILDREGRELALDVRLDSLYAVSREIQNKSELAGKLSGILSADRASLCEKLSRDKLFVWLARKIPSAKSEAVARLKESGLGFVKESLRVYPKGELACQLLGFTDIDNEGLEGVELRYNSFLKGVPGWRLVQRDAKQRELVSKELEMVPPVDGYNVHLTIDEVIQTLADQVLADTCKKFNAKGGSILVMDPKTGDLLALSNYPAYDLNHSNKSGMDARRNRAITDLFEPGSVFKIFTLAAILEHKAVRLDERFDCEGGAWAVAGKVLHDHRGHGLMSFREIIEKSSNIGTVKGAIRLGAQKFYKTVRAFGFGQKTGVPLAGEVNGLLPHPKNWSRSSIINLPIGQGIALTPMQLTAAVAAIANNGLLMRPRIVTHIDDAEGRLIQSFEIEPVRQVISRETSLQARSVMEGVVSRGTGKKAAVAGFKGAGKTGTAQKILPSGAYSHDHFIGSFVGFVPYDEPKVVVVVSIDEPHPVYYGGEVAAPAFSKVAAGVLAYWRIQRTAAPPEVISAAAKAKKKKAARPVYAASPKAPLEVSSQAGVAGQ